MREEIKQALKKVYDPEISVDIYELGLIYDVIEKDNHIDINMTLTSPTCPVAGMLIQSVEMAVKKVEGIDTAYVNLVFHPSWNQKMMSEEARLELGLI
tara:strand:+ start:6363 stop:6656 length:294 start_codon:yes stop_codon:yes gene_type:complete